MRELEARTGVHRETIRVFLREGLLPEPERPARNVADYNDEHVRAILAIRKLQQDSNMTLPKIKAILAGNPSERPIGAPALLHLQELVASRVGVREGLVTLASLRENNAEAVSDGAVFDRLGLITIVDPDTVPKVSVTDAGLIDIWGRMRRAGFNEENGFPPDILDYYGKAARYVAGMEADLFIEKAEGRINEEQAAVMLEFALPAMLDFFGIIRQKIFLENLKNKIEAEKASAADADPEA